MKISVSLSLYDVGSNQTESISSTILDDQKDLCEKYPKDLFKELYNLYSIILL